MTIAGPSQRDKLASWVHHIRLLEHKILHCHTCTDPILSSTCHPLKPLRRRSCGTPSAGRHPSSFSRHSAAPPWTASSPAAASSPTFAPAMPSTRRTIVEHQWHRIYLGRFSALFTDDPVDQIVIRWAAPDRLAIRLQSVLPRPHRHCWQELGPTCTSATTSDRLRSKPVKPFRALSRHEATTYSWHRISPSLVNWKRTQNGATGQPI